MAASNNSRLCRFAPDSWYKYMTEAFSDQYHGFVEM